MACNSDQKTIDSFGREWRAFDQENLDHSEGVTLFQRYFALLNVGPGDEGFDVGCGSGRWARLLAPKVKILHCIDPSDAIEVAKRNLKHLPNVTFSRTTTDNILLEDASQDFGCAIGVLHHIPETEAAMADCVRKLKPGGQFLVYLYYRFDNKPKWFVFVWRLSELVRAILSRAPFWFQRIATFFVAALIYYPVARLSRILDFLRVDVSQIPLSPYRDLSFFTMRTDAFDRLCTPLEQRFSQSEIFSMMKRCKLTRIQFNEGPPFWVAHGIKDQPPTAE